MATEILYKEFLDSFKDSLGVEGAEDLLTKCIIGAGLTKKNSYKKEEAIAICEALKLKGGFIGIVGRILESRFVLRN